MMFLKKNRQTDRRLEERKTEEHEKKKKLHSLITHNKTQRETFL